jgi:FAD/FMN-containing dehydrogenase
MQAHDAALSRLIERVEHARAHRAPLCIRGGGTKHFYGEATAGEPLQMTELSGISSYEPTELVVTARAGTPLDELEAALAVHGQCLPFEPPRFAPGGTLGGMVAAGLAGPARLSAGSVRDHVLGVTLLNGRGELLTFGGQVAKNVAGYDVSRLMAGSLGVLGILCEVSIKVLPVATATATLRFETDEDEARARLCAWASKPLPINAATWCEGELTLRLAGARAAVAAACATLGGIQWEPEQAQDWWTRVRDHDDAFFRLSESAMQGGESLWRLCVPATTEALKLPGRQFIDWGGAQRWWRTTAPAAKVRALAVSSDGHATLLRGADKSGGVFTPLSDVLMRIHRGLKLAFDPAGIFNPGRLYAGL